jgi:hypothetical protein
VACIHNLAGYLRGLGKAAIGAEQNSETSKDERKLHERIIA